MKKLLFIFVLLSVTTTAMSQIKVASTGRVGIGNNDPQKGKFVIENNGSEFAFHAYNKTDGKAYFGARNTNKDPWINFYHPTEGYNKVRFKQSIISSDSTQKTAIRTIRNATSILKQLKTYSFYFKSDSVMIKSDLNDLRKRDYGVLAQEVETILPDLVDTCNGEMFVNYNAFIGILIAGFNEQQAVIENLQNESQTLQKFVIEQERRIIELQDFVAKFIDIVKDCCDNSNPRGEQNSPLIEDSKLYSDKAVLYQNTPNPFSSNTEIGCYLYEIQGKSTLYIYNMQGIELKSYSITQSGYNSITVSGSELPAGMYLYTLVVDNDIIDTKRMILTK